MAALGRHIIVEFYDCNPEKLNDVVHIKESMEESAEIAGATLINSTFHHFSPYGVSGVVVIQESHLAIHTWPEYGFASVDVFTCGDSVDPWVSYKFLKEAFGADHGSAIEMRRGEMHLLTKKDFDIQKHRNVKTEASGKPASTNDIWFTERNNDIALSLRHSGEKLYEAQSEFQKVEVYKTNAYGNMLTLDGMVMTTEQDEYGYHEMISHVPVLSHPNPKRALVIGGGDGGTARELLKHTEIEEVVMVEIDDKVIEASKQFLPGIASAFGHPKLNLKIEDGIKYVKDSADASFDIVLVDSTDPVGPGEGLFTEEFYREVYRILTPNGIMVTQSESPRFNQKVFVEIHECYKGIYGKDNVHTYLFYVPTYPTGMWSFSYCAKGDTHPIATYQKERATTFMKNEKLQYYNEEVHRSAFALPNFVKNLLNIK
ncbi:MAG: polyamine aminopropyltransferase [Cyclobacteriaceae bacterium]|nr:polyamine aminopropyltransferase [Cyclobacteriaceae bacterium]MCH8516078.1 polyamine aminopropyltransferase [Cyclobacteriaceae bacterium]